MLPVRLMKSPELIDTVVRAYELTRNFDPIDLGGSSNLNLLFKREDLGYVARIYRAWVTQERLEGIQSVRATLRAAGLPFPQTRPAADGRMFIPFADWLVEVESFVGGQDMSTWAQLLDGMRMLGTIHTVLSGITAPPGTRHAPAANHIDAADASQTTRRACSAIRSWASSMDEKRIASLSEELANALWWRCWTSTLWRRVLGSTTSRWFSTTPTPDRPWPLIAPRSNACRLCANSSMLTTPVLNATSRRRSEQRFPWSWPAPRSSTRGTCCCAQAPQSSEPSLRPRRRISSGHSLSRNILSLGRGLSAEALSADPSCSHHPH